MFQSSVPIYLSDLSFKTDRTQEDKPRVVVCTCVIQPFTRALADDLANGIAQRLYTKDGDPVADLLGVRVAVASELQRVLWYETPDSENPVLDLTDVSIGTRVSIRKDGETPHYVATITLQFPYPTAKQLLFLAHRLNTQFFLEFEQQQGELGLNGGDAPDQDDKDQ